MDETAAAGNARKKKELGVQGNICWFCKKEGDQDSWHALGKLHKTKEVKIEGLPLLYHEPCAAYCSGMGEIPSNGMDEREIEKWYKYGERASNVGLKCAVCGLRGATAGCCMKQCSKTFHFTCARIAAFQGKAYFSVASRNVSCDKHNKWLTKPVEGEFMGMWMEGLGGWHGGLHQQAHNSWLPHLDKKHAEFRAKWLTSSNYPLTLLSPKPAAKVQGAEGLESDALDALASLCADRMDRPLPEARVDAPGVNSPAKIVQTSGGASGTLDSSGVRGAGPAGQNTTGDKQEASNNTAASGGGAASAAAQRIPTTDCMTLGSIARNPSNQENVKPSSPFLDVQIPMHGDTGTGTGFTQKVLGSNLHPAVHQAKQQQQQQQQSNFKSSATRLAPTQTSHDENDDGYNGYPKQSTLQGMGIALDLSNSQPMAPPVSAPLQPPSFDTRTLHGIDNASHNPLASGAHNLSPILESNLTMDTDATGNGALPRTNSHDQHAVSLDALRALARATAPSIAAGEAQQVLGQAGSEDATTGRRISRERTAPSRYGGDGAEASDAGGMKPGSRKRPNSAGPSPAVTPSGAVGITLEEEESEFEEDDEELNEDDEGKPKKLRRLKEVYNDPVSTINKVRHPRAPRSRGRRTPSTSAATSPTAMGLPPQASRPSDRPASRGRGTRGSITPSGSLDRPLSSLPQPISQSASPVSILISPPTQNRKSTVRRNSEPFGLDLQVSLPESTPSGLTGNIAGGAEQAHASAAPSFTRATAVTPDGSPSAVEEHPSASGPQPSRTLRQRCKPLQIDTSAATIRGSVEPAPGSSTSVSPTNTEQKRRILRIARKDTGSLGAVQPVASMSPDVLEEQMPVEESIMDVGEPHLLGSAPHARLPSSWPMPTQSDYSQGSPSLVITQAQQMPPPRRQGSMSSNLRGTTGGGSVGLQGMPHQDESFMNSNLRGTGAGSVGLQGIAHQDESLMNSNLRGTGAGNVGLQGITHQDESLMNSNLRGTGAGIAGLQGITHQDESHLPDTSLYADEADVKFEEHHGLNVADATTQPVMCQPMPARISCGGGAKDLSNPEQTASKVSMMLNGVQQIWVPEGMSGPEIAALAAQQNPQAPLHIQQALLAQPTIFTSSNMAMNGAPAVFAQMPGMNPHALNYVQRLPFVPSHRMMTLTSGLTPTGRPSRSTRCAVCIIQKKGKCGTDQAPKNCLRRNQNLGFATAAAGLHPLQFPIQHPAAAMLQVQGCQVVASPMASPLVSPLPSPLTSPSNQFGQILVQPQQMAGVSNAMLMQTPHGLQLAGGYSMLSRQGMQDRMAPAQSRGQNSRLTGMQAVSMGSNLSATTMQDQVLDLGVGGSSLRSVNSGSLMPGGRGSSHLGNQQNQRGGHQGGIMRSMPDENFSLGGINMGLPQSTHFMDTGLDHGMDDFQGIGNEWVQDPSGLNLLGSRMSGGGQHLMHPQDLLHDDMDHGDVPGPESPFPRAQDRITVFSGCVDILPPLVTGEERVLGITMHPRYAARFHAHMRSDAGNNAPLVSVPHNTAVFLQQRKVNPEVVVESLRGLIQESLLDPDVQPRFGLPDDLPVRGVDRFMVPHNDPRLALQGQWGLKTNEDVAAGTAIGAYGSYAMFREDHERFATNPPSSYRSVEQAASRAVLDAKWELLVESNAVSSTLPASLGAGALGPASHGLGEEEVVMCALGYGNLTALANDPMLEPFDGVPGERENTHVLMFLIHGWPLPIMVTLQDMPANTEVLYSYGQAYWDLISKCQQQLDELGP